MKISIEDRRIKERRILVAPPASPSADVLWSCDFTGSLVSYGLQIQAKDPSRVTLVEQGRDGGRAVRLLTLPGEDHVAGSDLMQRCDLWLTQASTDGYPGKEHWWAHSIFLPDDFAMPTWQMYVLFDFHNTTNGPGQANFAVNFDDKGDLVFKGFGGLTDRSGYYGATIGKVQKNTWYDFVYHVRWSANSDGFMHAWVNGKKILTHSGPTLYAGQGVYLKLASYHTPICDPYPTCIGTDPPSAVIHSRIIRGKTQQSVALTALE